jgi:hypothetical protein
MTRKTIYRLYTQDRNKRGILRLTSQQFESFTLQPILGYYRGKSERSIVLEIVGAADREVKKLARRIGAMNGQTSVLVLQLRGSAEATRQ